MFVPITDVYTDIQDRLACNGFFRAIIENVGSYRVGAFQVQVLASVGVVL